MDVFIEKLIAKRKTTEDYLFAVGIIFGVLFVSFVAMIILKSFWIFVFGGACYGAYYLISGRNIEFEYVLTNSDLDIDKIIAQRKRVRIFSGSVNEFEILAKVKSEHLKDEYRNINTVIRAVSGNRPDQEYFAVCRNKGERVVLTFEPDEQVLKSMKSFIPRKMHIE